jgi:hypothetical protein
VVAIKEMDLPLAKSYRFANITRIDLVTEPFVSGNNQSGCWFEIASMNLSK